MTYASDIKGLAAGTALVARPAKPRMSPYGLFIIPGAVVLCTIIILPWLFTLYMAFHDWKITREIEFVGLANFVELGRDARFWQSIGTTLYFTALAVLVPMVLGVISALVFVREFPFRGVLRTLFIMPMMATPVAVSLVWTMMFHPQLGVLNYLLTSIGIAPQSWVYDTRTVIPTLVLVETWFWTPLIMLIVLGGLTSLPREPYEAATIDGANSLQTFTHITLPLLWPYIMSALLLRTIDALKVFDTIYVITQGGPGTSSETLNIFLYLTAFSFFRIGYASAVVMIFFIIVVALSLLMLYIRQKTKWDMK